MHEIVEFHATAEHPLTIDAYGEGADPLLDGQVGATTEPQYGDKRVALMLIDCCHVNIFNLRIRGFGQGLAAEGACKDHVYSRLEIFECAGTGIGFGTGEAYGVYKLGSAGGSGSDLAEALALGGYYPEEIVITGCKLWSIGYDTAHQDIGLGHLSTNCTIFGNTLTGDDVRGVDGIVGNGASSGHLIEYNTITSHAKLCPVEDYSIERGGSTISWPGGAVFTSSSSCAGAASELVFRCDALLSFMLCEPTAYGYVQTKVPLGTSISGGAEAFGEDGIDLKGVRVRTPTSRATTVISKNTIYGNTGFSGITVQDGSQGVHICRNRIFQNQRGVVVSNSSSSTWFNGRWNHLHETRGVYIYRNLIYMNLRQGVKIEGRYDKVPVTSNDYHFRVKDVYVINNTIAHNLGNGVQVIQNGTNADHFVDGVYLHNNLFARNNVDTSGDDSTQVHWVDVNPLSGDFSSDNNIYLAWPGSDVESVTESTVVKIGSDRFNLADFYGGMPWIPSRFEYDGLQTDNVDEIDFDDWLALGPRLAPDRRQLELTSTDLSLAPSLSTLTYQIGTDSMCRAQADDSFIDPDPDGALSDLATDIEGRSALPLDVGAYEV